MKFIIKVVAIATEDNKKYSGQTHVSYYGKNEKMVCSDENIIDAKDMIEAYGYNRKCDAVRAQNHLAKVLSDMTALGNKWTYELSVATVGV